MRHFNVVLKSGSRVLAELRYGNEVIFKTLFKHDAEKVADLLNGLAEEGCTQKIVDALLERAREVRYG